MKRHNFKKLHIWTESMCLIDETYKFTATLPDFEKFGLRSQLNRCAVSIASNIAEGTSKSTSRHFIKFLEYNLGSAFELETQLMICKRQKHIEIEQYNQLEKQVQKIQKKISNFIDRLDSS